MDGMVVQSQDSDRDAAFLNALASDHPLLQQAQERLQSQLLATKQRLEEELQERKYAIKATQERRLNLGVELYGHQQHLAQLQTGLGQTKSRVLELAASRLKEEAETMELRQQAEKGAAGLETQEAEVEAFRKELNDLSNELRLLQQHTAEQQSSVLVQKGMKQATEHSVQSAAEEEQEQQVLIARLKGQIAAKHAELAGLRAKCLQQEEDTEASRGILTEVNRNITTLQSENRKRSQQWQSSLLQLQKQDAAIKEAELSSEDMRQQLRGLEAEIRVCRKEGQVVADQANRAWLHSQQLQSEAKAGQQNADALQEQENALKVTLERFEESLAATERALGHEQAEGKALAKQKADAAAIELLQHMTSRASADSNAKDAVKQMAALRAQREGIEREIEAAQQATAAMEAEIAEVEACSRSKAAALAEKEAELKQKEQALEALQQSITRQTQGINKKSRELDALNRKHEQIMAAVPVGEDAGPLEATISNLKRELGQKRAEVEQQQALWLSQQTDLHDLCSGNAEASEKLALLQSSRAELEHSLARLERQRQDVAKEIKELTASITRQHADIARLNGMLADTDAAQAGLEDDALRLQGQSTQASKEGSNEVESLITRADELKEEKQRLLSQMVQTERQVMETEKDIQIQKEMQLALHPDHGQAESAAFTKGVSRLRLRLSELHALQHRLQTEIANAIAKRETSVVKGRAMERLAEDRKGPSSVIYKKRQMLAALNTSLQEIKKREAEAEAKVEGLKAQHAELEVQAGAVRQQCEERKKVQERETAALDELAQKKCQELIRTARAQRSCKWYEEAVAGKLVLRGNLERQLKRASSKHEKLWTVLQGIAEAHPKLMQPLQRALMHHMNAQASDWPQTNKVQLEASVSQLEDSENQAALAHVTGD